MQDCTAPQSGPLSSHTSSALCMKGVWCRSGGVPLSSCPSSSWHLGDSEGSVERMGVYRRVEVGGG